MMTGIPSVSSAVFVYQILTLIFLLLFAIYDYRHHKIRNKAVASFFLWCLLYIPVRALADINIHWLDLLFDAMLGGAITFWLLVGIALLDNGGIGGGDIKLVTVLAIPFGTEGILSILLLSCLTAVIHSKIRRHERKQEHIAFAPYLFVSVLLYAIPQIIR